jgi:hypothetical protein
MIPERSKRRICEHHMIGGWSFNVLIKSHRVSTETTKYERSDDDDDDNDDNESVDHHNSSSKVRHYCSRAAFVFVNMSNIHGLHSGKDKDSDSDDEGNNRYVGGIGDRGGGR